MPRSRSRQRATWILTLLLGAALGLTLPWALRKQSMRVRLDAFEVLAFEAGRPGSTPPSHPGDAYVLRVEATRDAYPIVILVSAARPPEMLFPPDQLYAVRGGEKIQIPLHGSGVAWNLSGVHGRHAFVAAATRDGALDLDDLMDQARGAGDSTFDEDVERVERVLSRRVGPARQVLVELRS